jgi:uncharacterized membrane protein YbhN (UPF0104 family)
LKLRRVVQVVLALALLVGLWFFARQLQPAKLGAALAHARPWPIVLAVALAFGSALSKSVYWTVALSPQAEVPVWRSFRITLASVVASLVAPRGGDVFKLWQFKQEFGVDVPISLAVNVLEKVGDTLSMMLIIAPLPWLLPRLPLTAQRALVLLPVGLVLLVGGLLIAAYHPRWGRLRWLSGLSLLKSPKLLAWGFLWVLAAWLCDFTEMRLVLHSVGAPVGLGGAMLMILFVNLAISVPIAPGNAGVQEFGAVLALTIAGASPEVALAAALLYHATQTLPLVLAGLPDARSLLAGNPQFGPKPDG